MSDDTAAWDAQIPLRLTLAAADLVADENPAPVLVSQQCLTPGSVENCSVLRLCGGVGGSMTTGWVLRR